MYIIGITGPSGAGKTTALGVLEAMGGQVFDCDAIYHSLLASDGELLGRIEAAFPGVVQNGSLDRKALGARVFADPAGLERLTRLTQPLVKQRVLERIRASEGPPSITSVRTGGNSPQGGRLCVIDAIGLFESGLGADCDLTVAVVADPEIRVQRLIARDGITEAYARARIAAQKPAVWYAERADLVLENNGSAADFAETCRTEFTRRLNESVFMGEYSYITLRERPELEKTAAASRDGC